MNLPSRIELSESLKQLLNEPLHVIVRELNHRFKPKNGETSNDFLGPSTAARSFFDRHDDLNAEIILLIALPAVVAYFGLQVFREQQCFNYGNEFEVQAHSVSLLHMRCAADHWPTHRIQPTESQAHA
jgi:hypothetical protein